MRACFITLTLFLALLAPFADAGAQVPDAPAAAKVQARWELAALPSGDLLAVLWITPAEGYKTYAHTPGQAGLPTVATVRLDSQEAPLAVLYPPGKQIPDPFEKGKTVNVYDGPTPLFIPLPHGTPKDARLTAMVSLLACSATSCWPTRFQTDFFSKAIPAPASGQPWWPQFQTLTGTEKTAAHTDAPALSLPDAQASQASQFHFSPRSITPGLEVTGILKAIALALVAGFLLNLMPCVLPVACLKLSGLLAACAAEKERDRHFTIREHNLFFSFGVLAYFSLLALVLGLAGLAWGQLFQRPGIILGAAVVLFALGLSLFGVFHLPMIDLKPTMRHETHPKLQAFSTGFLATLLATPCSGPFLGGVLAWTLLQSVPVVMAVFFSIGIGMASPYMALAVKPDLVRFVPRPGAWLTYIEKLAGFIIMATCLYFLSILPADLIFPALAALLVTALACYAVGALATLSHGGVTRWLVRILALTAVVTALFWAVAPPQDQTPFWKEFDNTRFAERLGKENLFLDFTADWCPTCKALEKTVLTPKELARLQKKYTFQAIRVDLTQENPQTMALLRALGSASIPVAALFPKGANASLPVVLRDLYTQTQLKAAMAEAFGHEKTH